MPASDKKKKELHFTERQFIIAASWWAQFLPGHKKISFDEINQNVRLEGKTEETMHILHDFHSSLRQPVSDEQYNNFVKILAQKMIKLGYEKGIGLRYITLGDSSSYEPPPIVEEAMQEANIQTSGFGLFPYKTEMRIYSNGQIQVGNEVFSTNPDIVHYNPKTNFDSAPLMKITGDKFRLIELNLDEVNPNLLFTCGVKQPYPFRPTQVLYAGEDLNQKISQVYLKLYLKDFKGSEQEFLQKTQTDWAKILQDPLLIKENFKDSLFLIYYKTRERAFKDESFFDLGKVSVEKIANDYYQLTTGPVKILSAPKEGSVGSYMLMPVLPNDFIILNKNKDEVHCLKNDHDERHFEARLCDENGNILSNTVYKPGDTLPSAPSHGWSLTNIMKRMGIYPYAANKVHNEKLENEHVTENELSRGSGLN